MLSGQNKSLELTTEDVEDELPSGLRIPFLLRQNAGTFLNSPVAVYMIKMNSELIVDRGEIAESLENNSNMVNLGNNPIPCFPVNNLAVFRSELTSARHAFFQRPKIREILQNTTSLSKELIEIIVRYR